MQTRQAQTVGTYRGGNHFNAAIMLGIRRLCSSTVITLQTCHVLVITRASYLQLLAMYPDRKAAAELHATEKAALDKFLKDTKRVGGGKATVADLTLRQENQAELIRRSFKCWKSQIFIARAFKGGPNTTIRRPSSPRGASRCTRRVASRCAGSTWEAPQSPRSIAVGSCVDSFIEFRHRKLPNIPPMKTLTVRPLTH